MNQREYKVREMAEDLINKKKIKTKTISKIKLFLPVNCFSETLNSDWKTEVLLLDILNIYNTLYNNISDKILEKYYTFIIILLKTKSMFSFHIVLLIHSPKTFNC